MYPSTPSSPPFHPAVPCQRQGLLLCVQPGLDVLRAQLGRCAWPCIGAASSARCPCIASVRLYRSRRFMTCDAPLASDAERPSGRCSCMLQSQPKPPPSSWLQATPRAWPASSPASSPAAAARRRPPTARRRSEGAARCSKKKKVLQARTPYCSERRLPTERRRSEGQRQDLAAAERAYCRENTLLQQEHLRQRTPCGSENTLLQREHPTAVPCCCNLMVLVAQAARPIRPAFRSCSCSCC